MLHLAAIASAPDGSIVAIDEFEDGRGRRTTLGEVIRRTASVDDILQDLHPTSTLGMAKGGDIPAIVDMEIGPIVTMADTVE
jgi:hypothetical protein